MGIPGKERPSGINKQRPLPVELISKDLIKFSCGLTLLEVMV